jgi:DNA polymerase elongation subunit (family B)
MILLSTTSRCASPWSNTIDYDHYIEKQLAPVADALLSHLGTSFDAVLGGERQLDLF